MTGPLLREVNRRIYDLTRDLSGPAEFLCECCDPECEATRVVMHPFEFADVLAMDGCLVVAPGHAAGGYEVVRERGGYALVRETARV
jgi:hypothetical protein